MTAFAPPGGQPEPERSSAASGPAPDDDPFGDLFAQHGPAEHGPAEHGPAEHDPAQYGTAQQSPDQRGPGTNDGAEHFGTEVTDYAARSAGPSDYLVAGPSDGGRRNAIVAALAALAVLAAAGGAAIWLAHRHHAGSGAPAAQPAPNQSHAASGHSSPLPTQTPTATPTLTTAPTPASSAGLVTAAPGVAQAAAAPQVEAFLNRYFSAINNHDYQRYRTLLDHRLRRHESVAGFNAGYRSTTDSHATITSITDSAPGRLAVGVTFTSRQRPADSPSHTACTDWNITLFLRQHGGSYVIGRAPADYHAAYQAC